jgi:hypothetical protein
MYDGTETERNLIWKFLVMCIAGFINIAFNMSCVKVYICQVLKYTREQLTNEFETNVRK